MTHLGPTHLQRQSVGCARLWVGLAAPFTGQPRGSGAVCPRPSTLAAPHPVTRLHEVSPLGANRGDRTAGTDVLCGCHVAGVVAEEESGQARARSLSRPVKVVSPSSSEGRGLGPAGQAVVCFQRRPIRAALYPPPRGGSGSPFFLALSTISRASCSAVVSCWRRTGGLIQQISIAVRVFMRVGSD